MSPPFCARPVADDAESAAGSATPGRARTVALAGQPPTFRHPALVELARLMGRQAARVYRRQLYEGLGRPRLSDSNAGSVSGPPRNYR
jgi:hypothetical protein